MLSPDQVRARLDAFRADPKGTMQQIPTKWDANGQPVDQPASRFDANLLGQNRYVAARDTVRRQHRTVENGVVVSLSEMLPGKAGIGASDRAEGLVDALTLTTPADIDKAGLRAAELGESPWSDDYWALYLGILGNRYGDPGFPRSTDWKVNYDYVQRHPVAGIVASCAETGDPTGLEMLSPSEKYDLLVGDAAGTLTRQMWAEGQRYYDDSGDVETWMGICHGWAPAAYMLARPPRAIDVLAADGETSLRFFPSDIKSLASLLWARARTVTRFIGGRCNVKEPEVDEETGRSMSDKCFDTNPGTWHLAVVNQIGVNQRSFVMDATYDYQVWNQPVCGYDLHYFDPRTMEPTEDLATATVALADFPADRFSLYRGKEAKALVGVMMRVVYLVETSPSHAATDGPGRDRTHAVDYLYDLELDDAGAIVGGEWYQNPHPDFLWTPPVDARAITPLDAYVDDDWKRGEPMPERWRQVAAYASTARAGAMPLAHIVERLIGWSRDAENG